MLLSRMQAKARLQPGLESLLDDHSSRVLFYSVPSDDDMLSVYVLVDVVLDTFPAGGELRLFRSLCTVVGNAV
jgi:predicted O-linked N-acetylglucosamine transferase (SPINDLY family)